MKCLEPGHLYQLNRLDEQPTTQAELRFVRREGPRYPGNIGTYAGTTSQDVLRACRARAQYVNAQQRCWQTSVSIFLLGCIIWLYELRAAHLHHWRVRSLRAAIDGNPCTRCGHVHRMVGSECSRGPLGLD
jgi:hypothetical protein